MDDFEATWERIVRAAGQEFLTTKGLAFTYSVPGNYLRVAREGREINRALSKTNFRKAADQMPVSSPSGLRDRQGSSYTWAILSDARIRLGT